MGTHSGKRSGAGVQLCRVQVSKRRYGVSKEKRLTQSGGKSRWLPLCCKKATLFIFYSCAKDSMEMGERGLVNRD